MVAKVKALLEGSAIRAENSNQARDLYKKSNFGSLQDDGRVQLSPVEAVYLAAKKRLVLVNEKNKQVSVDAFVSKTRKKDKNFWIRYATFKDLRDRGYVVKTALKFGADFRVYDKGVNPGKGHARWIAYPVSEHKNLTWRDFSSKNRVAHSTKKNLLICVVDDENSVTYWDVGWIRP